MRNIITFIILSTLFISCSDPESDGQKAAKMYHDCEIENTKYLTNETQKFIDNFENYNFRSRKEARKESEKIYSEASLKHSQAKMNAEQKHIKLRNKYIDNYKDIDRFDSAFEAQSKIYTENGDDSVPNQSVINQLILSITPPEPTVEQIKQDLIGRSIKEREGGYYSKDWSWEIKKGEIQKCHINETTHQDDGSILYDIQFVLKGKHCAHKVLANITYILRNGDLWEIEFFENKDIEIIKTGKYNDCIGISKQGGPMEHSILFTNYCDVELLVGGEAYHENDNKWHKFSLVVPANGSKSLGCWFFASVTDCKIHFIEQP